ncbi:AAA family ATPase [Carnimonas bestiolae]|uniref:AAA family ATPase n=1 Tax=Carnimonas bestiolae TaxID=3402172 RepID=UPI003EDB862E
MKLTKLSISNFRSITKKQEIEIKDKNIILGKNNEGKSNILKALSLAMEALKIHSDNYKRGLRNYKRGLRRSSFRYSMLSYNAEKDFPKGKRLTSDNQAVLELEFKLNNYEILKFKDVIKSNINGVLSLKISFSSSQGANNFYIKVIKHGRGAVTLTKKSEKIAQFVADKVYYNYIPAVSTEADIINSMLVAELSVLAQDEEYKKAIAVIDELQKPILEKLSNRIKEPLCEFLPNISDVKIETVNNY